MTLGVYQFVRNATKFDYPLEESIESIIDIADTVIICECYSEDDTFQRVLTLQDKYPNKIKYIHHQWISHHSELSGIGNACIPLLNTDWHMQLQADEVLHEDSLIKLKELLSTLPKNFNVISLPYYHFLGNYSTEFDFCYRRARRIARKGSGWWLSGDAAQLDFGNGDEFINSDIFVYHYGKVKDGKVGYQKEIEFQSYYKDIGFPDPKMAEMQKEIGEFCDYVYLFESAIKNGEVREFKGTHPSVMKERIDKFKDGGYEQFVSKMREGLKTL